MMERITILKKFRIFIFAIAMFLLTIALVYSARQPLVSGDSNEWGTVLNQYLNVSLDVNGTFKNQSFNITDNNVFLRNINDLLGLGTTLPSEKLTVIGNVNISGYLNISGDLIVNKKFNVTASSGNVNIEGTLEAGNLRIKGGDVQVQSSAFNLGNYSTEYASTGYKLSNFTSNYASEYSSTGYKEGNLSSDLAAGVAGTIVTISLTTDDTIVNQNLYIIGNISNTNIINLNINASLFPIFDNLFDLGNATRRWRNANFSGTMTVPTLHATTFTGQAFATAYDSEYSSTGYKLSNFTTNFNSRINNSDMNITNLTVTTIQRTTAREILIIGNTNLTGNLNLTGSVGATRFTGKIDCTKIDGGSDADYCADATGAGGADPSAYNNASNFTKDYAGMYHQVGFKIDPNFTAQVPLCSGTDKITSSDGNTLICATDQTGAGGTAKVPREITMWRSDVGATGIISQGLNLALALTLLDATFNGTCRVLDFSNDIGNELACEVQQRTIVVKALGIINVSIRNLGNETARNGILCERRSQAAVIRNNLNMSNGTYPSNRLQWFAKPSFLNENKTMCVFTEGGDGAADFTFPRVILWHR